MWEEENGQKINTLMEASKSNLGLLSCPKIFTYTGGDEDQTTNLMS